MAYGQKNYPQVQGINGRYKISAIGCFLTSFCNLMTLRYGRDVNPADLNDYFVQHGTYIDVDDGVRDDLGWGSVTAFDGLTHPTRVVDHGVSNQTAGWPNTNEAIVRFWYRSVSSGQMITHFCLVADAAAHTIVDAWDGVVKQSPYGEPTAFAEYGRTVPVPVSPPPPPQASYKYERFAAPMRVRVKPGCNLWNLNYTGGYGNAQAIAALSTDPNNPTDFTAVGKATKLDIADHPVYFMSAESFGDADTSGVPAFNQGVNSVDLGPAPVPAVEAAAPVPAPAPEPDGDHIDVHVAPPNPDAWKASFKTNSSGDYTAKASVVVHDLEGKADDMQLVKGQTVPVAGDFTGPDGIKYYRTVNATNGYTDKAGVKHAPNWRGIPLECLDEDDSLYTFKDDLIDDFKELRGYIGTREKAIIAAAKIHGEVNWLTSRLKKKGK